MIDLYDVQRKLAEHLEQGLRAKLEQVGPHATAEGNLAALREQGFEVVLEQDAPELISAEGVDDHRVRFEQTVRLRLVPIIEGAP